MLVVIDPALGCTLTQDPETRLSLHFTSVGVSLDHHLVANVGRSEFSVHFSELTLQTFRATREGVGALSETN